jgi:hypothetical protein
MGGPNKCAGTGGSNPDTVNSRDKIRFRNVMNKLGTFGQKIKGKSQQLKGDIEIALSRHERGNIEKLSGKDNELEANIKMKVG